MLEQRFSRGSRSNCLITLLLIIVALLFSPSCIQFAEEEKLVVQDDFSDPSSGWQTANNARYSSAYSNGSYVITVKAADFFQNCNLPAMRNDFVIEVETGNTGRATDNSSSGIVFGWRDIKSYSVFFINPTEGAYFLGTRNSTDWSSLIHWKKSSAIQTGKAKNLLKVRKVNAKITVYVNGTELDTVEDDSVRSGQVGLGVSSLQSVPCSYAFDNFKLYEIPSSSPQPAAAADSAILAGRQLKLIYQDDFTKCGGSWIIDKKTTLVTCGNGVLNMAVKGHEMQLASPSGIGEPSDFVLELDARKLSGDSDSSCVIEFRLEGDSLYMYQVSDGKFFFARSSGGRMMIFENWRASPYLKPDSEVNHLKVICLGKRIEIHANGARLGYYIDQVSESGAVYLAVTPGQTKPDAAYSFDNFKLSSIE